jgi:hypothetical protein
MAAIGIRALDIGNFVGLPSLLWEGSAKSNAGFVVALARRGAEPAVRLDLLTEFSGFPACWLEWGIR